MSKIKLDIENLTVESFATTAPERRGGTVFAHESENTLCAVCTGSEGSPYKSACDFSCEWECGSPSAACGTNYGCPPPSEGCTGTTGTDISGTTCDNSGCDFSCDFAC
jgi:hypothetical protein